MKRLLIIPLLFMLVNLQAQTFVKLDNDTTVITEYVDGRLWAYRNIGNFVVGMTNYEEKDDYGKYYQILIYINNLGKDPVTFNPEEITSSLLNKKGDTIGLVVYSHERFMKKVKRTQAWAMALTGFSTGLNAGMAGYSTSYTTAYSANGMPYTQISTHYNPAAASTANMAAQTQIATLGKMMEKDKKAKEQGYLKMNTIQPGEAIIGYMNIKRKRGITMTVNIPVNGQIYSFDWDVTKK